MILVIVFLTFVFHSESAFQICDNVRLDIREEME